MLLDVWRRVSIYLSARWACSPGRDVVRLIPIDPKGLERAMFTGSVSLCMDETWWPCAL